MPIPGTFGGFPFDPEVYQGFVDQDTTFSDSILASGILASDQSLAASLDNGGTMGTIRFYNPLDLTPMPRWSVMAPLTTCPPRSPAASSPGSASTA